MEILPKLHLIGLGKDGLSGPASKLAGVVLHLGGENSTTLRGQLGPPVEGTTTALGLVVELVEGLDNHQLVLTTNVVLDDSIQLGTDNHVNRLGVGFQGKIEAAVLVSLGCGWVGLFCGVVEGVLV